MGMSYEFIRGDMPDDIAALQRRVDALEKLVTESLVANKMAAYTPPIEMPHADAMPNTFWDFLQESK